MANLIFKPSYVDMGFEPSTKTIFLAHNYGSLSIGTYPDWLESEPTIEYTANGGGVLQDGIATLSFTVGYDIGQRKYSGMVEVIGDYTDYYYIPIIYSYDSEYIPISRVIDNVLLQDGDGYNDRYKCNLAARRWVQDNPYVSGKNIRFAEAPIEDGKVYLPSDFMDYIALYTYTPDGYLLPLYVNKDMNIASGFLQDENNYYILDNNGFAISVSGITDKPTNDGIFIYPHYDNYLDSTRSYNGLLLRTYNIQSGVLSYNGMYRYVPEDKCFVVSNVPTDNIVIQYISDPILSEKMRLDVGELSIHKMYREALEAYIKYQMVNSNSKKRQYEKDSALRDYSLAMKRSSRKKLKISELIQIIRGSNYI